MTRRTFAKQAGLAALAPAAWASLAEVEPMKVTRIEAVTFRKDLRIGGGSGGADGAEFCWVRLHTNTGLVGTGETYPFSQGELGALRDYSRRILGRDPRDLEGLWRGFYFDMAMRNAGGADMRILSAVNMALEPYQILYLEDAMPATNARAYAQLAQETSVPICVSETLATRYEYRELFELKACDVLMYDLSWCGGPTEARKISDLADTYLIPTSPHTCGGPLLYICSTHLCAALPNFLIMESNWWKYTHQYPYFVENVPVPEKGHVRPPELPGIGAGIKPGLFTSGAAMVETVAQA